MKKLLFLTILLFSVSALWAQNTSYNYEEMTQEQYNQYLQEWQGRLAAGNQGIKDQDTKQAELKAELESLNTDINNTWSETYAAANSDAPGNEAYVSDLGQLKSDVNSFVGMSAEDIYSKMNEIDGFQKRLDEAKANDLNFLSVNSELVNQIQNMINQATDKGKGAVPPSYTVNRGDYLWKIAAKEDVYGDAYAWMRIYTSNKDQIKNPDLIFPNQTFMIPRVVGSDEHLVQKGENLSMIAGYSNVYGSSFKWQKLYEANKNTIADPQMIFPYQVLKVVQ